MDTKIFLKEILLYYNSGFTEILLNTEQNCPT